MGFGQQLHFAGVQVERENPIFQGDDCAALLPQRHRADDLADIPGAGLPGRRIKSVHHLTDNVDEVEGLLGDVPERSLADQALCGWNSLNFPRYPPQNPGAENLGRLILITDKEKRKSFREQKIPRTPA